MTRKEAYIFLAQVLVVIGVPLALLVGGLYIVNRWPWLGILLGPLAVVGIVEGVLRLEGQE